MMNKVMMIVFVIVVFLGSLALGATPTTHPSASQSDQITISLLQSELNTVRDFQDTLLTTVFWSLGTIATIAVLLVGFGWYSNFRVYERDKASLSQELRSHLDNELAALSTKIEQSLNESRDSANKLAHEQREELSARVNKTLEATVTKSVAPLSARIEMLKSGHAELQYAILEINRERWRAKGVYTNALREGVSILNLTTANQQGWRISRALDAIQADLKVLLEQKPPRAAPDAELLRDISSALDQVSQDNPIPVNAIKDLLARTRAG